MKLKNYLLLLATFVMLAQDLAANPGDTTWVTVFSQRKLTHYGNYDTVAVFPVNKRYRKIRLHYILGRYGCPSGTQYCGSWDYTTQIWARPKFKDSVEIARVITPYASDWFYKNKKHDFVIDVTDYASTLRDSTSIRFHYSGYSWGFTITLRLELIEGVPPRDAYSVRKIYDGYFPFGSTTNSIENYLVPKVMTYTSSGAAVVKNTVSGHGADVNNCAEFCSKYYQLKLNNSMISQKQLWRTDCGSNQVYPQTGTWIYSRANWCPGAVVNPIYHDITALTAASQPFTVNVDMQAYTAATVSAGYNWSSQLINYSAPNHSLDASIEDIVAPSTDMNYARNNPVCKTPVIRVGNMGSDSVKSIVFSYGVSTLTNVLTHTAQTSLGFLDQQNIELPVSSEILTHTVGGTFHVNILAVNGVQDQNSFNDAYTAAFSPARVLPKDFVIRMKTNNSTDPVTLAHETTWEITDEFSNSVLTGNGHANNTTYVDTLRELLPGCYRFDVRDAGCDGLGWWANASAGNGSITVEPTDGSGILFNFPIDFGCGYVMDFIVEPPPDETGLSESARNDRITAFPNPADNVVHIAWDRNLTGAVNVSIRDISGRVVQQLQLAETDAGRCTADISALPAGAYIMSVQIGSVAVNRKLLIQR